MQFKFFKVEKLIFNLLLFWCWKELCIIMNEWSCDARLNSRVYREISSFSFPFTTLFSSMDASSIILLMEFFYMCANNELINAFALTQFSRI